MRAKTYHLWTIGCQMNEADSRHLASQLETIGYVPTGTPEDAEIVVLNTCVVRQAAENKIYGRLGSLKTVKQRNPGMTIGLMGCMVGMKEAPALRKRFPFVDVFMPPSDTSPLIDYLIERHDDDAERARRDEIQDAIGLLPMEQRGRAVTAFVPVVLGCSHACTFCIIPYRRGIERSRPEDEIVAEIEHLAEQGVREVMLLGQIVDRYGLDFARPSTLANLLRRIHRIEGISRIRFLTSHPNWMTDELLQTVAGLDKVCPHIEVPIQAGNDDVLAAMRRGYTVAEYYALIDRIRAVMPDAAIHTDIIVGFPGESTAQFDDTMALLDAVRFDKVHISTYSMRPKTVATRTLIDDIPLEEKNRRRDAVDALQKDIQATKNDRLLDTSVDVLVDKADGDRWRGRTAHNKLVFFRDDRDLLGRTVPVTITRAGPYSLTGKAADRLVEVVA